MRTGVYALLAVVVGVVLVGVLPGQLSNLAAPTPLISLQSGGAESAPNVTTAPRPSYSLTGNVTSLGEGSSANSTGNLTDVQKSAATAAVEAQVKADAAGSKAETKAFTLGASAESSDPYADLKYYGMWGVGLIAATAAYFASKRLLG